MGALPGGADAGAGAALSGNATGVEDAVVTVGEVPRFGTETCDWRSGRCGAFRNGPGRSGGVGRCPGGIRGNDGRCNRRQDDSGDISTASASPGGPASPRLHLLRVQAQVTFDSRQSRRA